MDFNTILLDIDYLEEAYSKESELGRLKRVLIAKKLIEIIANIGQVNTIRFYYKKEDNCISKEIA